MSLVGGVAAGTALGGEAAPGFQQGGGTAASPAGGAKSDALAAISLSEASARIQARSVTAVDLVNACLGRIDAYNPKVNAFITVMREAALAQARTLDAEQRDGKLRGPLHGIPIALKDNIDTAGVRTTAASAVFDDRVPAEDAPVASRLAAAGAIVVGKANLHEFAFGGTSATSYSARCGIRGRSIAIRAGRPAVPRQRSPPTSATRRSAPTRAAPFALRPLTAASSA